MTDLRPLTRRLAIGFAALILGAASPAAAQTFSDAFAGFGSNDREPIQIEAKELLAQPVVQDYMMVAWRGDLVNLGWAWIPALLVLLLNLLFLLPLVAFVPALEPWLAGKLDQLYFLHLPVVKFGLVCAADLALALALTLIPAADLATAPVAPLLLAWVGSGLLWEARQVMAPSSSDAASQLTRSDAKSRLTRLYDRLAAYWADGINRVDERVSVKTTP